MSRKVTELYPDYTETIEEIKDKGISVELIKEIIRKHKGNSLYNRKLYDRYKAIEGKVPIDERKPRFDEENPINNKLKNDFFGEIVEFKTGYFAGAPFNYGYSKGKEAEKYTGGKEAVKRATKAVTDFVTRNNMYGVDMETTKNASICGYAGRLFYIDTEGDERVMPIKGYETIILSKTNITEPEYAIRYFYTTDLNNNKTWIVEFYDDTNITTYKGKTISALMQDGDPKPHLFDYCPLQGVANNEELLGDAEKVMSLIDDYDKVISDNSNEIESFVHAYLIFEGLRIDDETIRKGQKSGSFVFPAGGTQQGKAYFLTKNINDVFTEHHLQRLEDNIYRFSKTPNLNDTTFGTASGESLKFKLHGLETKCGMYQAQMMNAAQYMWKVLASAWKKKRIEIDPLLITIDFKRNFPLNLLSEAQTAQTQIAAGLPKEYVYSQMASIDDVNYIMELIEAEKEDVTPLYDDTDSKDDVNKEETQQAQ